MDFLNAETLLECCRKQNIPISGAMLARETSLGSCTKESVAERLEKAVQIMRDASHDPIENPKTSIGGLIGGEAQKVRRYAEANGSICGSSLTKAISYGMAVLEVNATMGLIVAAPTAGSAGVVPGVLLALQEEYELSDETLERGLLNAGAIGYILMRNASVSGAEAGCQAEVGAASAMAAGAAVEMLGGTPEMSFHAASLALSNLLGLVCDPIAGLVEAPCQSRNAIGVANAFTCAQLALSGVTHPVPFDEMAEAMYKVGRTLPFELRETAMGGNAGTPTGCALNCGKCK
ncbi:L-serine ammonia-lyase, iron-sulfur-dependent, subunit alpha [Hespellia stercorisuis]|uniref:L-serine dehydratase n=1 Tax=Hespellia stercorisuis DSM 15480 TaxID=1121950 RepID=A0A1M6MLV6_9FIRM|nr:L-serine ammonia-lyase, iron-sulfur-dependent, subunit alpha [Hespellia stercorisuis]SHJ84442.1 L-serine dehydratase [Hespellia stercorisuis DSM 15480]